MNYKIQAKCVEESRNEIPCKKHDLEVGKFYNVESISMGQSYTSIGIDGKIYNSVLFEFYENGKEIDIYNDKRFNPYLSAHKFLMDVLGGNNEV